MASDDHKAEPLAQKAERKGEDQKTARQGVLPPASPAKAKRRHLGIAMSFVIVVIIPLLISAWYLYARAADQYASLVGFSVRSESTSSPADVLGGLGSLVGSNSTSDTDVLFKFIQSRDLVERVDRRLDLRKIWSKPARDPIFGFHGNNSMESLVSEWRRKVTIHYSNGMIDLRILAFDPHDAQNISTTILDESGIVINQLNDVAREDALRYSRNELQQAQERLQKARKAMSDFRHRYELVDPAADVQSQNGLVTSLQQQLAEQLVALGLLQANAQENDPRISQAELRVKVIRQQIASERQKFGSDGSGVALSDVVGQYETLAMDRQFAETSYTTALAGFETAQSEAVRQSRYLAPYIHPTLAQDAEFPQRAKLLLVIAGFLFGIWIVGTLMFYSLRDRR
ncbi:MAG: sugar transporter [Paracoccus denitrificans]|nr:MAG: sugar transporter [Paracoccus denitrificans]PZO85592.1 MAG: sugar transporter [Paracoccus denitrificans]